MMDLKDILLYAIYGISLFAGLFGLLVLIVLTASLI